MARAAPANLSALSDLSGQWIDIVHGHRPPKGIVLDMDLSVSPTHGEQEMSVWNGHYQCTCYHPLFVFNASCVPATCTAPTAGRVCSNRYRALSGQGLRIYFSADAAFAMPVVYECLEAERSSMRSVCPPTRFCKTGLPTCSSAWRSSSERGATVLRQFQLPGGQLDQAAPGDCQGRVAPG